VCEPVWQVITPSLRGSSMNSYTRPLPLSSSSLSSSSSSSSSVIHHHHQVSISSVIRFLCTVSPAHTVIFCGFFAARCYAERGYATVCRLSVCLSVCPSVTLRCDFHKGWNTSKIISQLISLRFMLGLAPKWVTWSTGSSPQKLGWSDKHKNLQ